jgi:hypothetical protein
MKSVFSELFIYAFLCAAAGQSPVLGESTDDICSIPSRPDCLQAVAVFEAFQKAVTSDERKAVASMIRFPLRVRLGGKKTLIRDKSQLLRHYDSVFDSSVKCAIARAKKTQVRGNSQGFTVADGVVWWERSHSPHSSFKAIRVDNGAFYHGCGEPK